MKGEYLLDSWTLFDIDGADSERFLSGQLTSDVSSLINGSGQLTSRVSRTGQLLFYGYLLLSEKNSYKLICPSSFVNEFIEDLDKFLIMDEVELSLSSDPLMISFERDQLIKNDFVFNFLGYPAAISQGIQSELPRLDLTKLAKEFGLPNYARIKESNLLINQTVLVDEAVSDTKGCYVGQETVKKIEANRGAGKKDLLLEFSTEVSIYQDTEIQINDEAYKILDSWLCDGKTYIVIESKRGLRVNNKAVNATINNKTHTATVKTFPIANGNINELSRTFFEDSISLFTQDNDEEALRLISTAAKLNPFDSEIIEAFGALEGRLGNHLKAIELMDHLEKIDPDSVMAHTNKSLYFMKLGEIEKAEDEKSKATVKSFQNTAQQNQDKKAEMMKRLDMFTQVLEIDHEDEMANQGSADIYFELGEYDKSLPFLNKLIEVNRDNFKALALKAKIHIKNGENTEALSLLKRASLLSGEKGDFVLANETQSLINSLEIPSS